LDPSPEDTLLGEPTAQDSRPYPPGGARYFS
jgi:hypothetical protein